MKKSFSILAVLLAMVFVLPSCDKEENVPGSIYGIVVERGNTEPVVGASVELYTIKEMEYEEEGETYTVMVPTLLLKTVTASDGSYEFKDLTPGEYALLAAFGTISWYEMSGDEYLVTVEAGRQARADLQVENTQANNNTDKHLTVKTLENTSLEEDNDLYYRLLGSFRYDYSMYESESYKPIEYGFIVSSEKDPLKASNKEIVRSDNAEDMISDKDIMFSKTITKEFLNYANPIYYVAYATNRLGTVYGSVQTFLFPY